MIYIAVALSMEAKPIIEKYNLKRDNTIKKFQVFENEKIILIITGVGIVRGMIATTYLLSIKKITKNDIFLNFGVVGSTDKKRFLIGDTVICNKIINKNNNISFYPDMIFSHNFKEGCLETFIEVVKEKNDSIVGDIVDMEGAGIAKSASYFFNNSQIFVIKTVSDYLGEEIIKNNLEIIIKTDVEKIIDWILEVEKIFLQLYPKKEKLEVEKFCEKLRLSSTMKVELKELLNYYELGQNDVNLILKKYENIEVVDKREGKRILDEIRKTVIK